MDKIREIAAYMIDGKINGVDCDGYVIRWEIKIKDGKQLGVDQFFETIPDKERILAARTMAKLVLEDALKKEGKQESDLETLPMPIGYIQPAWMT